MNPYDLRNYEQYEHRYFSFLNNWLIRSAANWMIFLGKPRHDIEDTAKTIQIYHQIYHQISWYVYVHYVYIHIYIHRHMYIYICIWYIESIHILFKEPLQLAHQLLPEKKTQVSLSMMCVVPTLPDAGTVALKIRSCLVWEMSWKCHGKIPT